MAIDWFDLPKIKHYFENGEIGSFIYANGRAMWAYPPHDQGRTPHFVMLVQKAWTLMRQQRTS
jgi:hypothetical protein